MLLHEVTKVTLGVNEDSLTYNSTYELGGTKLHWNGAHAYTRGYLSKPWSLTGPQLWNNYNDSHKNKSMSRPSNLDPLCL